MPKISIIVPVYKVEKYLHRCLDSIVAQTFTDWECILVDDGSPDNSGNICDEYAGKDNRFRVFHQENAGVSAARNKGLDEAKGEWITFIDSDDWVDEKMYEELFACAVTNAAEVVVSGRVQIDGIKTEKEFKVKNGWLNMPKDFEWYIQSPCAKLFSRTILHKYNIRFPEGITLAEDLYFVFQVFINCQRILGTDKVFYNYLKNSNSVTKNISEKNIQDHVFIINKIEDDLNRKNSKREWKLWLLQKKYYIKGLCINGLKKSNLKLWRQTFPEINYCFKTLGLKQILIKLLILTRLYNIISFLFKSMRLWLAYLLKSLVIEMIV